MKIHRMLACCAGILLLLALVPAARPAGAAAGPAADIGYADFSFFFQPSGRSSPDLIQSPTGEKPQSKLWYHANRWWADLFSPAARVHRIHVLDRARQRWLDTGVTLDPRPQTKSDCLWDGAHLYVASGGGLESTGAALDARLFRYSYAGGRFRLDAGFPVTIRPGGAETIVLAKDTTGRLWATFAQNNAIYVTHSLGSDAAWRAPFVVPAGSANTSVAADDISSIVAYGGKIGVLWSNQRDGGFYFASHADGAPASQWSGATIARRGGLADDHISLRALQAGPSGSVFAAVKTSFNSDSKPRIELLIGRPGSGGRLSWRTVVVSEGGQATRPLLMLDASNRRVHIFLAEEGGGAIYLKSSRMDAPAFDTQSKGQPVLSIARAPFLNNPTSTKQLVTSASDLVVLASYDNVGHPSANPAATDIYAHALVGIPNAAPGGRRTYVPLARR